MIKTPRLKPQKVTKALERLGFREVRQHGSHARLVHPNGRKVTVAKHKRPIFVGTLHLILNRAKISLEIFLENL